MSGFTVDVSGTVLTIRGVLRLESVDAYDAVFGEVCKRLPSTDGGFTIDLRGVTLMNSSGIRALANLVLLAKQHDRPLVMLASPDVGWQKKTLASLAILFEKLDVRS